VTLSIHHSDTRLEIKINGLIHLWIEGKLTGIHSYMTTDKNYFIEWHYGEGLMILTEYDKKNLWGRILKLVDKKLK